MDAEQPRFELQRVFGDGSAEPPHVVPVIALPWDAQMDRRGFLGAGIAVGAVVTAAGCSPRQPTTPTPSYSSPTYTETQYQFTDEKGVVVTKTLPCGTPLPPGATCTCNCIPAAAVRPTPAFHRTCTCDKVCSCIPVCTCKAVPVCQAHRLLDDDPVVGIMAEELLLVMGADELPYLTWAADTAGSFLRRRIVDVMTAIRGGARADTGRWPASAECVARLRHPDEVVAIMAAQMLELSPNTKTVDFDVQTRRRIGSLMGEARRRPWYVRASMTA